MLVSLLKILGQRSLDMFQSMNPFDLEKMLGVAKAISHTLCYPIIDLEPFFKGMKEHIQCSSSLTKNTFNVHQVSPKWRGLCIKTSHQKSLLIFTTVKKVQFDNISQLCAQAVTNYETLNNSIESLLEEVLRVRGKLLQLEKHLSFLEA